MRTRARMPSRVGHATSEKGVREDSRQGLATARTVGLGHEVGVDLPACLLGGARLEHHSPPCANARAERDTNAARGRVGSWAREGMKATDDPWAWAPGPRRAVLAYSLRRTAAKRKVKERGGAFGELPIRDLLSFARECPRTVDGRKAWHAAV